MAETAQVASNCERRRPSAWVERHLALVASGGQVLDVACGSGRHTRLALAAGHGVTAIDRDLSGVADLTGRGRLQTIEADLEADQPFPLEGQTFAGVVVTNYLWRPLLPAIVAAVAADGVLIYETFAIGQERFGRPRNPDFLLLPGELLDAIRGRLVPVAYEHGQLADPPRMVQRIAAVGPGHAAVAPPKSAEPG